MKNILLLLLFTASTTLLFAQKVKKEEVGMEYIQLPLQKIEGNTFTTSFDLSYTKKYDVMVENEEKRYQAALADHDRKIEEAKQKFEQKQAEWDNKKLAQRVVEKKILGGGPPTLQLPPEPTKRKIQKPYCPSELTLSEKCQLEGFEKSENGDVMIHVKFHGYEEGNNGVQAKQVKKDANCQYSNCEKVNKYYKSFVYRHKGTLSIQTRSGEMIEEIEMGSDWYEVESTLCDTREQADEVEGSANKPEAAVNATMKEISKYMNDKYGYQKKKYFARLRTPKSKKVDYSTFEKAYALAKEAYLTYAQKGKEEAAIGKLQNAIQLWEAEAEQVDLEDKKARVNKKVYFQTMLNIIEASVWANDFEKVDELILKTKMANPGGFVESYLGDYEKLAAARKERFDANQ